MKIKNTFAIKNINNKTFLIPFGQSVAAQQRALELNSTSVFICNALKNDLSADELLSLIINEYHPDNEDIKNIAADIRSFLQLLKAYNTLECNDDTFFIPTGIPFIQYMKIAGITIKLTAPKALIHPDFESFKIDEKDIDNNSASEVTCADLCIDVTDCMSPIKPIGNILIRSEELMIIDSQSEYICIYLNCNRLKEWHLSKNLQNCKIFCSDVDFCARDELFNAIRMIFLVKAQSKNLFAIHSSSLLYNNKAWLFSGHSGAGKSTHTSLWKQLFNTPLINGDLNLIGIKDNKPTIYGIPWCGTSQIFDNKTYPLGGIIFLRKSDCDEIIEPENHKKILAIMSRLISPSWTIEMMEKNLAFSEQLFNLIFTANLKCTKNTSAAITAKKSIDSYLENNGDLS